MLRDNGISLLYLFMFLCDILLVRWTASTRPEDIFVFRRRAVVSFWRKNVHSTG